MARAGGGLAGAVDEELLDDAILERMEGDDHQTTAGLQHPLGRNQRRFQFAELVVHRDAQRLEGARRRVDVAGLGAHDAADDVGKALRRGDRGFRALADDGLGDMARQALLAIGVDEVGEVGLLEPRDEVGGAVALARHAHVERPVEAEGEAAVGLVQLHGGDADIEHDAVDRGVAAIGGNLVEIGETVVDEGEPAADASTSAAPAAIAVGSRSMAMTRVSAASRMAAV